jgi:SAM-dependent methyltransferase
MSSQYRRPAAIPPNMGGSCEEIDARLAKVIQLLETAPIVPGQSVLDVGMGSGQLSMWLAQKGLRVTGTGLELDSYLTDPARLSDLGVKTVPCSADSMPFNDASFDVVVMSHVLEHCPNQALALAEVRRVLRNGGHLIVLVPAYTNAVCSGHVSTGWNVGQLLYVLLLAGFCVQDGSFIEWCSNVCAFVTKREGMSLPALRGDRGDLHILSRAGLLPMQIKSDDGFDDGFCGDIGSINFTSERAKMLKSPLKWRALSFVGFCIPLGAANLLFQLSRAIQTTHRVNPSTLTT